MFTLFYAPGACSLAPHVALEWIGEPFEARRVKFHSAELLAVNPAGAVPVLRREDGWTLTQAGAILHFLARRYPQAGLGGEDTLEGQAELDRWSSFFTGDLHPSFYPIFMADRYTTATEPAALDAVREAGRILVRKRLALLDAHLAERPFILGDRRSVVDAYAFPMLRWSVAKLPEGLRDVPHAAGLYDRLAADAGVRKVLAEEGLT
jgi:glutathione S-transferase